MVICPKDDGPLQQMRGGRRGDWGGAAIAPPLNFGLSKNDQKCFLLSENFFPEMQNLKPKHF